jgi:fucose permease
MRQMVKLLARPLVAVFALSAFMYVMTEQGIMSWLPSFNKNVLHLPEDVSIYLAVILMLSIALGRYLSSLLVKRISWIAILLFCLGGAALMVLLILPQTTSISPVPVRSLADVPLIAYVFPLIGFFLAPLYPMINSFVLSATEKRLHGPMASLLVIFSALGGTLGSKLVGYLFAKIGGENAFYFSLAPMLILVLCVLYYGAAERKIRAGKLQE